jgi:hypothetical protein
MTDPINVQALQMARAAVTAMLIGDEAAVGLVMTEEDPELLRACCETLVGMFAGQISKTAYENSGDPLEFWQAGLQRQMSRMGY